MTTIARNLALLLLVALPIAVGIGGVLVMISPPGWAVDLETTVGSALSALTFQYVILAVPVLVGGILHQLLLWGLSSRSGGPGRIWVVASSPLVLVPLLLPIMNPGLLRSWVIAVPTAAGLLVYGLTVKPLSDGRSHSPAATDRRLDDGDPRRVGADRDPETDPLRHRMTTEQYYLQEVFERLLERGKAAREAARAQRESGSEKAEFLSGVSQGYYEAVTYMLGQLDAFDISRSSVGVPDILSPEDELL